jgi:hypothetical protein
MQQQNMERSEGRVKFRILNHSQGGQESTTNALLLDQLIDPNGTDVIIWEFSLNDMALTVQERKLNFWLLRVRTFFVQAGRLPPPPFACLLLGNINQVTCI